ncbi:MAG: phosphate/phosphite/phosphonate ABC transporter substrate-binding protein [Proteobacteria bacterium]|nr:phosphate/phosphite/phosphonate ABC transporter substrate-binding protein [Pseudomonadota bacterium]
MRKYLLSAMLGFCAMNLCFASGASAPSPLKYTFAVVPQFSPSQLHQEWIPVLQRISHKTGIALELKLVASFPKFESELMRGVADFAYVNPYHVVMSQPTQGYLPLLRDSKPLVGILLARKDSAFKSPQDLKGQIIAFSAPNAFGASLFMRALLTENFALQFTPRYLGTHSNVFRHLAHNDVAAGGSVMSAFNDELPEVREQLHIIYKTPEVASHPIVVHPRVPAKVREAVLRALLDMTKDEAGRALLKEIRIPNPVLTHYEKDFLSLETLKIQKYLVVEKN